MLLKFTSPFDICLPISLCFTVFLSHGRILFPPSIQSWDVSCFLKVARTVAQHCMERIGEESLSFPLLKSGKRQKVHLGRNVSNHFVADWRSFIGGSKGGARGVRPPSVIFRANWSSKGRKIYFFWRPGPPVIWRSGSASEFPSCWRQTVDARIWLSWDEVWWFTFGLGNWVSQVSG